MLTMVSPEASGNTSAIPAWSILDGEYIPPPTPALVERLQDIQKAIHIYPDTAQERFGGMRILRYALELCGVDIDSTPELSAAFKASIENAYQDYRALSFTERDDLRKVGESQFTTNRPAVLTAINDILDTAQATSIGSENRIHSDVRRFAEGLFFYIAKHQELKHPVTEIGID